MLQNIRDHAQGWIAWTIIIMLCLAFGLWGIQSYLHGGVSTTVAKVNGKEISQNQLRSYYERLRRQEQVQLGADFTNKRTPDAQLKKIALEQLITNTVLTQSAHKHGYRVAPEQIDAILFSIPEFQVDGKFSRQRYQQVLSAMSFTPQQFMNIITSEFLIGQVRSGFVGTSIVLPDEVNETIRLINQKRDIAYTVVPASRFTKTIKISPPEIQAYYEQHKQMYKSPEQVSIQYVTLSTAELAKQIKVTDAQVNAYYDANKDMFTKAGRWHVAHILIKIPNNSDPQAAVKAKAKAQAIYEKAKAGANFTTLAKQDSQDALTAQKGGVLPWFNKGTFDPQFEKAAMSLKPGQIAAPVRTKYGYEIIKLLAAKPPQVKPLAQVQQQIRTNVANQKAEERFADESDQLANLTYESPNSLEPAAKKLGLSIQSTNLFGREGAKTGIAANLKIIEAAFSSDVLTDKNNSSAIMLNPNTLVVLRVQRYKPAAILPLSQVKDKIVKHLTQQAAQQKTKATGQKILTAIGDGHRGAAAAQAYGLTWRSKKNQGRNAGDMDTAISQAAFSLPKPTQAQPISVKGVQLASGDYAVVMVSAVKEGKLNGKVNIKRSVFKQALNKALGQLAYELYVVGAREHAKVKVES